ncbi:hypothetical protein EVG22_13150 [Bacillus thuringiensis serovar andalousiensis]|uniref:ATP-sulfurylase PUA-like domain-containing protein n=1 Tax=Bacillus thuringiensis serovar andalousiensis TaxID=257985 RepID=A0A6H0TQ69_BACTU|nr:hypothetical protein EVG22_13150 [Bacillus thuringiensis serovar andalousiensis]
MRLKDEFVWSIFITLAVTEKVKLTYNNIVYGVLELKEKYLPNKVEEVKKVFQIIDSQHHEIVDESISDDIQ